MLIRDAEWRALSLEGTWIPVKVGEWRPLHLVHKVRCREYDKYNRGYVITRWGARDQRGPYKLVSRDPPVWESNISGAGYGGVETLTRLEDDILELSGSRT